MNLPLPRLGVAVAVAAILVAICMPWIVPTYFLTTLILLKPKYNLLTGNYIIKTVAR